MAVSRRIRVLELRSIQGAGGGPEKTILLGAAQAGPGIDVTVCYVRDRRDKAFTLGDRARALGVSYVEVDERRSVDLAILRQLEGLVRDLEIDLVHAHEYKTDLLGSWLSRKSKVARLATAHGWTGQSHKERLLYYPLDKFVLAHYPRVIAVSTDIKNQLIRYGARSERVTVILNSIDPIAFQRRPERRVTMREQLGCSASTVLVGSVGRVEKQKRFDILIQAMRPILRHRPDVRLVIAGDGSLLPELQRLAGASGVGDQIHLLGHRTDIADLHQAFDLFVQSSEYEGTPNAVLEAMAMETPLVATDVGGTRELAFDDVHALLVPSQDVAALGGAIDRALTDPAAARTRASAARHRVETELSFDVRTRRLEAIYEELVDAQHR